jgi:hypothetical protein
VTIPGITFVIQDGALGAVPANAARICAKLGICSGAVAFVAASKLIGSTTSPDGVTFTARTKGAGGNQISVTYATPSGGTTGVTVSGNAISVTPKSGAVNSDIVTAIQANATANALVTVAATVGSDLVVAVAQTYLTGGITGNINTVIPETSPTQAVTDLGYGPLTESTTHSLAVAGGTVLAVPLNPSTAGTNTSVSHVGTGGGTVAVSGTPNDSYNFVVNIVLGGALGTAQFKYSLDGGASYSATFIVPSGGTYAVPKTGLTLTFASTFVAADLYTFGSTAPSYVIGDVQDAVAALLASGQAFGFIHLVGTAASVAASASMAAAMETLLLSAASVNFVFAHADLEVASDTDANVASAFTSTVCTRVNPCAGFESVSSSVLGSGTLSRNCGFSVAAREAAVPEQNSLGRVADGPVAGVTAIARNEALSPSLDAVGFTTLRTYQGLPGAYFTQGHMLVNPGSDFFSSQNRRVMDLACGVAYAALLPFLNDTLRVNTSGGTISDAQAATIENTVNGKLAAALIGPGAAVASSVVVDRTNNVLATKTLNVTVRVLPFAYPAYINVSIGFTVNI